MISNRPIYDSSIERKPGQKQKDQLIEFYEPVFSSPAGSTKIFSILPFVKSSASEGESLHISMKTTGYFLYSDLVKTSLFEKLKDINIKTFHISHKRDISVKEYAEYKKARKAFLNEINKNKIVMHKKYFIPEKEL